MRWPSRHIWDTRIQGVCGVLAARGEHGLELYLTATFAQMSLDPPRIAINPNRIYPIEGAIRASGRFSVSVMPATMREPVIRLMALRRREPDKAGASGLEVT